MTLESAIPCETQAIKWSVASRERYYNIAAKCDKETMLQREYTSDCMDKRNRYMVDHADYILAVWNGCPSGTGNTVRYAHKKGKSRCTFRADRSDCQENGDECPAHGQSSRYLLFHSF
ncbi:MAG: SLOG family protein [Oscillospiraceae bacterium]